MAKKQENRPAAADLAGKVILKIGKMAPQRSLSEPQIHPDFSDYADFVGDFHFASHSSKRVNLDDYYYIG